MSNGSGGEAIRVTIARMRRAHDLIGDGDWTPQDSIASVLADEAEDVLTALVAVETARERAEHERDFWKGRYDVQHGTVHRLEDAIADLRAERDLAQEALRQLKALALEPAHASRMISRREIMAIVDAAGGEPARPTLNEPRERLSACVKRWPECETGAYDPRCCRFPKSCSCTVYGEPVSAGVQPRQTARHYGRLDSFPPYVGGDDDEIDEWQAECDCGWRAERRWSHVTGAYDDLVKHLNGAFAGQPRQAADQATGEGAEQDGYASPTSREDEQWTGDA